jgi:hypothetical protein
MTATEVHAPVLGEAGEPCRECGAPLAADQRYCLSCGARRSEPRLDHGVYTREVAAAPPPPPAGRSGSSGSTVVAGVATLLLAMGIGVLIGRAGRDDPTPAKAAAPQVIKVTGGAAAAPAATTSTTTAAPTRAASRKKTASSHKTKATNATIKKLDSLSPKEYQKQSQKLPKTVGTGGKPPPKDNKKPAGGGSFDTIG